MTLLATSPSGHQDTSSPDGCLTPNKHPGGRWYMPRPPSLGKPALLLGSPSLNVRVGMLSISEMSGWAQHALHQRNEWPPAK